MTVFEKAYAKINLFLDVTGRREDGFHEILSVMHSVSLFDSITVSASDFDAIEINLSSDTPDLPCDKTNIAYRIAEKYLLKYNITAKIDIHIAKRIPIGAGLGGGSSDGAAVLRALYKIFSLGTPSELVEICAEVGSDIPFCLFGGMYLCGGRGEKLKRLNLTPEFQFVIAIGTSRVSTPKAYAALDEINGFYVDYKPSADSQMYQRTIYDLLDDEGLAIPHYNAFEQVVDITEINAIKENMTKNGAELTLMSGSGPAVFCYCKNSDVAESVKTSLLNNGFSAYTCESVYPEEFI